MSRHRWTDPLPPLTYRVLSYDAGGILYDDDADQEIALLTVPDYDRAKEYGELFAAAPKLMDDRDRLLAALKAVLEVANVRIDDPRCAVFDEAREAVKAVEGGAE